MKEIVEEFAELEDLDPEVVQERWAGSPVTIAEDLFQVVDIDTGEARELELFDPEQTKVLDAYFYSDARTINLYKGRRIGYSFICVIAMALDGIMTPNQFFPFVGIKEEGAMDRISDLSDLLNNAVVDIPLEKDNSKEIVLWNGTRYKAYSGAPDSSRGGDSAKAVLLDEQAFYEDQETVSRAYRAFLSLGSDRKMLQVSTPKLKNDLFMKTHREGTSDGSNGTLSIKQPSFKNASEIDPEVSLYEQETSLVRPDMDLGTVEDERRKDPKGFAQEYLCRPIDDSYAFFDPDSITRAMERTGSIPVGTRTIMGVDIGISEDDTVISIFEHNEDARFQRHMEVVTDDKLGECGIENPDRANANHVATRIHQVFEEFDVDTVVMDKTGPGETFERIVERKLGGSLRGFNFSAKDDVRDMMGDLNNALRNDRVQLIQNDRQFEELSSILKIQTREGVKPRFSGKDTSETGKDDTAIAAALGAFPPGMAVQSGSTPTQKYYDDEPNAAVGEIPRLGEQEEAATKPATSAASGSTRSKRGKRRSYNRRYTR